MQVVVQKYVQNRLPEEKVDEVFHTLQDVMKEGDRFITVYADLDLAYKITNELEYEASRFSMVRMIEEKIAERFTYWKFESEEGHRTFIIKTQENTAVHELKELLEEVKEENSPVIAAISKPYKGIRGIRRSFEEAQRLFAVTNASEREYLQSRRLLKKRGKPISGGGRDDGGQQRAEERRRTVKAGICTFYLPTATQRRTAMPVYAQDHGKDRIHVKRQLRDGRITESAI